MFSSEGHLCVASSLTPSYCLNIHKYENVGKYLQTINAGGRVN